MATPVTKKQWLDCVDADGNPLPVRTCNGYRIRDGLEPLPEPKRTSVQCPQTDHKKKAARAVEPGGPGTELKKLLALLGISAAWCDGCTGRAAQMDAWGVDGCRERIDTIAGWLRESAKKQAASTKLAAAWNAAWSMTWINPLDPYRGLAQRAIDAAREKLAESQTANAEPESAAANS